MMEESFTKTIKVSNTEVLEYYVERCHSMESAIRWWKLWQNFICSYNDDDYLFERALKKYQKAEKRIKNLID